MKQLVCGRQDRVRPTQMVRATALCVPEWDVSPPVHMGSESWNMGIGEQTQGEDCCWLRGDSQRGWERGNLQLGMLVEETQTAVEARRHC